MSINPRYVAAGGAAAVVLATPLVMHFEGLATDPYRDVVGVTTVCYGETLGVQHRRYSDAECAEMLNRRLHEFEAEIRPCLPESLPVQTRAALVSWSYNVGTSAACGSSLARKAQAGDLRGACAELSRWVYAGGKVYRGLERRRQAERELCESGLPVLPRTTGAIG